jgi:hypothetical protein
MKLAHVRIAAVEGAAAADVAVTAVVGDAIEAGAIRTMQRCGRPFHAARGRRHLGGDDNVGSRDLDFRDSAEQIAEFVPIEFGGGSNAVNLADQARLGPTELLEAHSADSAA